MEALVKTSDQDSIVHVHATTRVIIIMFFFFHYYRVSPLGINLNQLIIQTVVKYDKYLDASWLYESNTFFFFHNLDRGAYILFVPGRSFRTSISVIVKIWTPLPLLCTYLMLLVSCYRYRLPIWVWCLCCWCLSEWS